jgi:putative transposase
VLHDATNLIVSSAAEDRAALAFEDLKGIGRMCRRGNGQGNAYRFRLNSWPHWMAYKMLDYKAAWRGLTVIQLTKAETMGSSSTHACGERLRSPARDGMRHRRMQWYEACEVWVDRDVNAAVILSERGLTRLASSLPRPAAHNEPSAGEKGFAVEAMRGNPTPTAILRVDASKLHRR